jgi:transposase
LPSGLAVAWLERGVNAQTPSCNQTCRPRSSSRDDKELAMMVMIGVDPHKGSHTAVAVDSGERSLAELRVRSGPKQLEGLLNWATAFPERTWAVENATGLGYLLAQQLVATGERVLDVQPKLAARVRLLATESTNKNDPHDALSVAVAALRSKTPKEVGVEDHAAVMKLWSRRHRNLSSARTQVVCRLHAVLCELVAGGVPDRIYAEKAALLLADVEPDSAMAAARVELAGELLDDLRRVDRQLAESKRRLAQVVAASGTTTIAIFGVGPFVATTVVGVTGDIARFPTRDRFAAFNGTAPIEVSSGGRKVWRLSRRGNRTLNHAIHMAAVTQLRFRHSPGRGYYDRKIAEGKTPREALRALKRRISDALWTAMVADARCTATVQPAASKAGPGGQPGNDSLASAAGSHPDTPALRPSHSRARTKATSPTARSARGGPALTTTARRTA